MIISSHSHCILMTRTLLISLSRITACFALVIFFAASCSNNPVDHDVSIELPVHYVAIDIDDIFMPNWDYTTQKMGTVKMNAGDVSALVQLGKDIRSKFGTDFRFTIGFNCGFFNGDFTGDAAFLDKKTEFNMVRSLKKSR